VTTFLVAYSKIAARLTPLGAVRRNPATPGSELREEMCHLVSQSAINLSRMMHELRIQCDQFPAIIGAPGARFQSWIPFYPKFVRNSRRAVGGKECARLRLQGKRIACRCGR
jgi:hypothetical protein